MRHYYTVFDASDTSSSPKVALYSIGYTPGGDPSGFIIGVAVVVLIVLASILMWIKSSNKKRANTNTETLIQPHPQEESQVVSEIYREQQGFNNQ